MLTKTDLSQIRTVVKEEIQGEIKPVKKSLKRIERGLDETIEVFDADITHLRKRVDRVEDHLHLSRLDTLKV